VALTLRALGGMTTGEIARAFLVAEPTMGKRIVRAKRKIADAHSPTASRPTRSCPTACAACCGSSI
jgi:RNA polymerase sigma-70 factor (ECF subfamily)